MNGAVTRRSTFCGWTAKFRLFGTRALWGSIALSLAQSQVHAESGQALASHAPDTDKTEAPALEVFKGPQIVKVIRPKYPKSELMQGNEARIRLNLMVDTEGRPYEITPVSTMGGKQFVKEALRVAKSWRFEPGELNGVPVDSGYATNVVFHLAQTSHGAGRGFLRDYRKLRRALQEGDREVARAALSVLEVTNLYEEAYLGYASATYYVRWGTKREALAAMAAAVAVDHRDRSYLPEDAYQLALRLKYQLELELGRPQDALEAWQKLQQMELDPMVHAKLSASVAKVEALRQSDLPIEATGVLDANGSWFIKMFKRDFTIAVESGRVQELKLRCKGGFVFFGYDPELTYSTQHPGCSLQVLGTAGAEFVLTQS